MRAGFERTKKPQPHYLLAEGRRLQLWREKDNMEIRYSEKSSAENPSGNFDIKVLKGKYEDLKRLRVGNYRVIFEDEGNTMSIYEIKHRQEAYQ